MILCEYCDYNRGLTCVKTNISFLAYESINTEEEFCQFFDDGFPSDQVILTSDKYFTKVELNAYGHKVLHTYRVRLLSAVCIDCDRLGLEHCSKADLIETHECK